MSRNPIKGRNFRPFGESKTFVHTLALKSSNGWKEWCKSGEKPNDIPANPPRTYKEQWISWGDWLGSGRIADQDRVYRTFEDAKKYVHSLELKNQGQWKDWSRSGRKPNDIPARPDNTYKEKWQGWGDWLGTGFIAFSKRQYLPFEDAKKYVHSLELKSQGQWKDWSKSGKKPANIPADPSNAYKKKWKGMGDWLGTGYIATFDRKYRDLEKAREVVHELGLKTVEQWNNWCRSGQKPDNIPARPNNIYKDLWQGWGDWLGTGTIALQNKVYR
ncbi:MAG: integrase repeat-containing protein, partial [Nitrososphaeraceae archaeon]